MLDELFELQAALNKRIGNDTQALRDNLDPLKAGVMLNDYLMAASNELEGSVYSRSAASFKGRSQAARA